MKRKNKKNADISELLCECTNEKMIEDAIEHNEILQEYGRQVQEIVYEIIGFMEKHNACPDLIARAMSLMDLQNDLSVIAVYALLRGIADDPVFHKVLEVDQPKIYRMYLLELMKCGKDPNLTE